MKSYRNYPSYSYFFAKISYCNFWVEYYLKGKDIMYHLLKYFTAAAVIVLFCFCSKNDNETIIETIDGVSYVHNKTPKWGDEPKVTLEYVRQIGDYDAEDDNYFFYKPGYVLVDTDSNIYVLDAGNHRIQKFDSNIKYLATFGRKGQGPGEFGSPSYIQLDNDNNLIVSDISGINVIYKVFSQNGRELRRFTLENNKSTTFLLSRSGNIICRSESDSTLMAFYNTQGKFLFEFGKKRIYADEKFNSTGNRLDFITDEQDNIYLVFKSQNRIEKYSPGGKLIFKADRKLSYKESTSKKREKHMVEAHTERGKVEHWEMEVSIYNEFSRGVGIDIKGRLWTETNIKQFDWDKSGEEQKDHNKFEIFNSEGILLGYLPIPDKYFSDFEIYGDRMYFPHYDECCIYEYKIVEK